ncbi:MAG: DegV family protein [Schaedlerella sp.]|nr:DegV family protein [Lachnospiraceae bacterium]MDY4201499.1 DegV family protein [Schaedlerella sp.]
MSRIAVITDSNSGITQAMGKEMGIYVIPMPFFINGELFLEDISLTQEEFYKKLDEDADISTSQPSPGDVIDLWEKLLKEYDEIVHIPMSSGLSSTCETAIALSADYDGKIQVVNNQRISVTQEQAVKDALALIDAGKSAAEIKEILEREKLESTIYITVDTLKYLKKGGRVTAAGAALGTVLNMKPVLTIQGEKLDAYAKVRGWKAAKRTMLNALEKDIKERFATKEQQLILGVAYTSDEETVKEWVDEVRARFPGMDIIVRPLSLSVACHIGRGALAVTCTKIADIQ